jgi:hypothetical protein
MTMRAPLGHPQDQIIAALTNFVTHTRARAALRLPPDPSRRRPEPPELPGRLGQQADRQIRSTEPR